jgi:predicted nucleic acid-binding protein
MLESYPFIGDERVKPYFDEIAKGRVQAYISDVNLAEYYYKTCEKLGKEIADLRYHQVRASGLVPVSTDEKLTWKAGEKKCKYRDRLSLTDCFFLALSELKKATLLTTDSELTKAEKVTVLSDIDVLIVTSKKMSDSERGIKAEILRAAEDLGFPWYYPIDIHIACTEDLENYRKHGKLIEIA